MNCSGTSVSEADVSHSQFQNVCQTAGNDSYPEDVQSLYDVPAAVIALLSLCYGSISVLAVLGNALVMWIVATSRRMQNVTNCFIANLALADIVIGLFAIPFQFQAALLQRWSLPHFMCAFCPFVQVLSVNVSIFTLTAIAVDRHRAILNPLSARPSKLRAKICIACIWCVSGALAAPMAVALRVIFIEEKIGEKTTTKPFCDYVHLSNESVMVYRMVLVLLQYITPLCVISYVYSRMALRLWGSRTPGNAQDTRDANLMRNKKRVIKMLVIVVALFAICWLPLQTYNVLNSIFPQINGYHYINIIWFVCDWLAMSNSCYNPFIYGIYNEKFKREFRQRFPWRSRAWNASPVTESVDLDRSSIPTGRFSVRSSASSTYDWRRSYSTSTSSRHQRLVNSTSPRSVGGGGGGGGSSSGFYRGVASRRALDDANGTSITTELYVFPAGRKSDLASSMEELCSL